MHRTRCITLLAPALLAGCATSGGGARNALLTDSPRLGERSCSVAAEPAQLPAAGDLVDVDALRTAVQGVRHDAGLRDGYLVFSIRHSRDGTQVRRAVLDSNLPAAVEDTVQKLMFAYRRQAPAARDEWGVRVRVDLGEQVGVRVGRHESCTPRPRVLQYRTASNPYDVRNADPWDLSAVTATDPSVVWIHVELDERGTVTDARVQGGLSRPGMEQTLLNYVRTMGFTPATEDGYPVPGELTLPVRLSMLN